MGSLMMISPLRILMLYRHDGLVQTQALYSMEAPWLPKSESGTRSPSLHLRQRGNAFSTKSPPSFLLSGADTPCHKCTGVLPSSRGLATAHRWSSSKVTCPEAFCNPTAWDRLFPGVPRYSIRTQSNRRSAH